MTERCFLQHMISKSSPVAKPAHGSRLGIVFSGSPLLQAVPAQAKAIIRKWIIEN
jgi:type I restriction enzyme M protein